VAVSATVVKELREKTGAGMMDCKKALEETNGDFQEAEDWLRKKGISSAAKKAGRATSDGTIAARLYNNNKRAVIAEINCETDFVAKTADFAKLVDVVCTVLNELPALPATAAELPKIVEETRAIMVGKLGENMMVQRFGRIDLNEPGKIQLYIHPGSKLAVIAEINTGKAETVGKAEFVELAADIGMQIAAAAPSSVDRHGLAQATIDHEMEIAKEQARATGKPEAVVEKIAQGKMDKIYSEFCLLEQPFVKDPKVTVTDHIATVAKTLGDTVTVKGFIRYKLGE